jgi:putative transposase
MDYVRDSHRVHLVAYHLVWCPRRRKRALVGPVAQDCERIIREVCVEHGWEALRLAVQPDHVHLFVRADPSTAGHAIARAVKGRTSRILRDTHRELSKMPSLWTRSYFCSTVGNVSQATVDRYIAEQIGR